MTPYFRIAVLVAVVASVLCLRASVAAEGELRWGLHVMYAIHDAMVKPIPAGMTLKK